MSANNISQITATNTFGQWKDVTNQVVNVLEDVVTLGDSDTENREGNVYINGSITSTNGIITDVITPDNQALNEVLIAANARALGGLTLDRTTTLDSIAYIQLQDDGVDTWAIETAGDHDHLQISKGAKYLRLDESDSTITASGLTVDNAILPDDVQFDSVKLGDWTIAVSGTNLSFAYNGSEVFNLTNTGGVTASNTVATTGGITAVENITTDGIFVESV